MVSAKFDGVRSSMCDYLENYLQVRLEHEYEVWGKNREELRQTKAVLDAQLQVIDEKEYRKQRKISVSQSKAAEKLQKTAEKQARRLVKQTRTVAKRKPEVENKIRKDVAMLKKEGSSTVNFAEPEYRFMNGINVQGGKLTIAIENIATPYIVNNGGSVVLGCKNLREYTQNSGTTTLANGINVSS